MKVVAAPVLETVLVQRPRLLARPQLNISTLIFKLELSENGGPR